MKHTNTVVIGGGQAGLAMSFCLSDLGIDHIVLERGRIGERWRSERWDSLRLLSPNWMARLPGYEYTGRDPDGFMTMPEFIRYLERYATSFEAPVQADTTVTRVERTDTNGFEVATNRQKWRCSNIVIATGFCDVPRIPEFARGLSNSIDQLPASLYKNPAQISSGGVLVVGASATGLQIADELQRARRDVTIAVGTHVRLPRRYRGRDVLHWMVNMGAFAAEADPATERASPPPQLIGTPENRDLDLGTLQDTGVRLVGRLTQLCGAIAQFSDDLAETVGRADAGMKEVLTKIDAYVAKVNPDAPAPTPFRQVRVDTSPTRMDLDSAGVRTVIWATGYQRSYPWLKVPVLNCKGDIEHQKGITAVPGLYVLGMRFQGTKASNLIDGVGADAQRLAHDLAKRRGVERAA